MDPHRCSFRKYVGSTDRSSRRRESDDFFPGFAGMGPIVPSRGQGPGDHLVGCLLSINYQG